MNWATTITPGGTTHVMRGVPINRDDMAIPRARSYKEGVEIAAASADGLAKTDDTPVATGASL